VEGPFVLQHQQESTLDCAANGAVNRAESGGFARDDVLGALCDCLGLAPLRPARRSRMRCWRSLNG